MASKDYSTDKYACQCGHGNSGDGGNWQYRLEEWEKDWDGRETERSSDLVDPYGIHTYTIYQCMCENTTKGDVVKRSDCILVYGSTTKGDVVKRSDCILVYGNTTKGDVVKRSDCILVYGSTTKCDVVKRSNCILVYWNTTKGSVVERSDCILYESTV